MSYVPKELNEEQQVYVLGLVNTDYEQKKTTASADEAEMILATRRILAQPPAKRTPRGPKADKAEKQAAPKTQKKEGDTKP